MNENDSVLRSIIVAVIIFIPLTSIQHFIPPVSYCLLADICNHTWIPECGQEEHSFHLRLFLDECDMWEYNCDFNKSYIPVNYADCFSAECPTLPARLLTKVQGYWVYYADGRRQRYVPPPSTPMSTHPTLRPSVVYSPGLRRYTPEKTRIIKQESPESCFSCNRGKTPQGDSLPPGWRRQDTRMPPMTKKPNNITPPPKKKPGHMKKPSARKPVGKTTPTGKKSGGKIKSSVKKPDVKTSVGLFKKSLSPPTTGSTKQTTKVSATLTTQVLHTGTIGTVILSKVTVWKNGKKFYKVVKGFVKTTIKEDSEFLDN